MHTHVAYKTCQAEHINRSSNKLFILSYRNMKVFRVLFLFTIAASQLGLAKPDDALNKNPALLKPEDMERALWVTDLYYSIVSFASVVHDDTISWSSHQLTIMLLLFAHILTHTQRQQVCQVNLKRQVFQVKGLVSQEREIIQVSQEREIKVFQEREFAIINLLGYFVIAILRFLWGLFLWLLLRCLHIRIIQVSQVFQVQFSQVSQVF